jgi:hypothetical protein
MFNERLLDNSYLQSRSFQNCHETIGKGVDYLFYLFVCVVICWILRKKKIMNILLLILKEICVVCYIFALHEHSIQSLCWCYYRGRCGRDCMVVDSQLLMQSVPITTNAVSSNSTHGEVYSIQHYVMKFVSDSLQVGGFLWSLV